MISAHQLSRACRDPGYKAPGAGDEPPPAYMTVPTTCARAAVRLFHTIDAKTARVYLAESKVGTWRNHSNNSMASGANAVLNGFDWYTACDTADGRTMAHLDDSTVVTFPDGTVSARLDVVLEDGDDLAGRVVLWDGPRFDEAAAPVMACAFAQAMTSLYPGRKFTTVGIWQARRQQLVEVPFADAMAQTTAASARLAAM